MKKGFVSTSLGLIGLLLITLGPSASILAKDKQTQPPGPRIVWAVRADEAITIDGRLEEKVWQTEPAKCFTQTCPNKGYPATERTKVWVAYDDKALYVAAMCYDSEPKKIKARLGRRDDRVNSDWFFFALDPYNDKRSGYNFGVNPAGSIIDGTLSNDFGEDDAWDGIWESKAVKTAEGWSLEMKIPFNQIRFRKKDEYVWGVNFQRVIKRKDEIVNFVEMPANVAAFISRFALLKGIKGISPGRVIELTPYAVSDARFQPAEAGNPFQTGHRAYSHEGFDFKLGLKSNLTLDATANPDFGEVEVDPAVINLSAYETYYDEKRPFFIEGASIFNEFGQGNVSFNADFNWPKPSFFYSRRIGRAPEGEVTQNVGFVDFPESTSIREAAKATGKFGPLNVGIIEALTAREYAAIDNAGVRSSTEVEPSSSFSVLRAQVDINQGAQGLGLIATEVCRDLPTEALSGILNKKAFSLAFDGWSFLDKNQVWVVSGWAGGTRVEGTVDDILRLQTSFLHYYQRPDVNHVRINPAATSLSGWGSRLILAKQSGNVIVDLRAGALSPGFDPNDVGFQYSGSDIVNVSGMVGYQYQGKKPGKIFQDVLIAAGGSQNRDFGWNKVWQEVFAEFKGTLKNSWKFISLLNFSPATLDNQLTRGGPMALSPIKWQGYFNLTTDTRRPIFFNGLVKVLDQPKDGHLWNTKLTATFEWPSNISLSVGPQYEFKKTQTQWVGAFEDSLMTSTLGSRYVFAQIEQKIVSAEIRLTWGFTPKLTLQAYLQPYIASGKYSRFKELARPRVYEYNLYGEGGSTIRLADGNYTVDPDGRRAAPPFSFANPDFKLRSLRGTVVFRWEYRPSSLVYFVWTQSRSDNTNPGILQLGPDLGRLLTSPGQNIFLIKVSYHWNI